MKKSFDVVVVGGGIIGLSCAWWLARRGVGVCVIDRGQAGAEASWAAGGILTPIHLADYPPPLVELCRRSVRLYPDFVEEIRREAALDPEYIPSGVLYLVLDDEDEAEAARLEEWKARNGEPYERLTAEQARALEPALSAQVRRVLRLPDICQVRNNRLVRGLALALRRRGVEIREHTPCTDIATLKDRALAVKTFDGEIPCARVLLATGAWARDQVYRLGQPIAVKPIKGQMILSEAAPGFLRHILIHKDQYVIPRLDGRLVIGATMEDAGFDKHVTLEGVRFLAERAAQMAPALRSMPLLKAWAGLRPGSADRVPFLGPVPKFGNVFLASGHFRNGILLAPATADIMSRMMLGESVDLDLRPFRLDR